VNASRRIDVGLFVALSLLANGYRYGSADHALHLPMIDAVLDPERWAGDALVAAAEHHHTVWFWLLAPAFAVVGPAATMALGHLAVLAATGAAVRALALELWGTRQAAWWALILLAAGHATVGGAPTMDPLLLPRGAALPLELTAFWLAMRGRAGWAFGLLGVTAWLHAPSAAAATAALACWHGSRRGDLRALGAVFVGAAPILLLWALRGDAGAAVMDDAWWRVVRARSAHHVAPSTWSSEEWWRLANWAGLGVLAVWRGPRRGLAAFGAGALLWAVVVGSGLGEAAKVALAVQLEAWEAARFLVVAAGLALAGGLAARPGWLTAALGLAVAARVPGTALAMVAVLAVDGLGGRRGPALRLGWLAPLAAAVLYGAARFPPDGYERRTQLVVQPTPIEHWIGENTAPGDLIAVAPGSHERLRWAARRPVVATWKDGGEALFSRSFALRFRERMHAACGCAVLDGAGPLHRPPGERLAGLRRVLDRDHSAEPLPHRRAVARAEGASWLVTHARGESGGAAFVDGRWAIYDLRAPPTTNAEPPTPGTPRSR